MGRPKSPEPLPLRARKRSSSFRIVSVASEVAPWAKTGGLGDVTAALPAALARLGHDVTTVMPLYRGVTAPAGPTQRLRIRTGAIDEPVTLRELTVADRHRIVMVDAPSLYNREGLYGERGHDYVDNAQRFAVLAAAALEFAVLDHEHPVDVLHAHDWQAGLVSALVRADPSRYPMLADAGTVFTIHNLAYQGLFPRDVVPALGLPWSVFNMERGEFWGQLSFLKLGITYADFITTVSPTYALETLQPSAGVGMEGALKLRAGRYIGILNGIDTDVWNPRTDPHLAAPYDEADLSGKRACKRALLDSFGLPVGDDALARPVVALVSRLVDQKGLDLVIEAAPDLLALDATWIVLGTGEARYEQFLRTWSAAHPSRVGVHIGFDEVRAHRVIAGADVLAMPSRFEPCGLSQLYALRYGTVPVVTPVGGLADTVQPYTKRARHATGFKLKHVASADLVRTLRQAVRLYDDAPTWLSLVRHGMAADFSWQTAAEEYVKVYRQARDVAAIRGGL